MQYIIELYQLNSNGEWVLHSNHKDIETAKTLAVKGPICIVTKGEAPIKLSPLTLAMHKIFQ